MHFHALPERPLPGFVRDLLSSPPRRGEGLNRWFFRVARVLHPYRTPDAILELLRVATVDLPVRPGEVERAIANSRAHAWRPGAPNPAARPSAWPKLDRDARAAVIATGQGSAELWGASPMPLSANRLTSEDIVDALFPGDPLLCVGRSMVSFATRPRSGWRGKLTKNALIVPSPMSALTGRTKNGQGIGAHARKYWPTPFSSSSNRTGAPRTNNQPSCSTSLSAPHWPSLCIRGERASTDGFTARGSQRTVYARSFAMP